MKKAAASPPRTLSVGGAAFDIFLTLPAKLADAATASRAIHLPLGAKVPIDTVVESPGGGAANTSTGLKRLGCDAAFCGVVGDDKWGERILEHLRNEGVATDSATVIMHESSGFSVILLFPDGERTILHHAGTNERLTDVTFDLSRISDVDAVYLNRLSEDGCMIENDIVRALTASPDIHLTWNPGGCQIANGMKAEDNAHLLARTDLLLLNKEEALAFTNEAAMEAAMQSVLRAGAKRVCVTDGSNGVFGSNGKELLHVPAKKDAHIVDATGAGDAFGSAATWAILHGETLPVAMKTGTLQAASVIGAIGAQAGLLTETEIRNALQSCDLPVEQLSW